MPPTAGTIASEMETRAAKITRTAIAKVSVDMNLPSMSGYCHGLMASTIMNLSERIDRTSPYG